MFERKKLFLFYNEDVRSSSCTMSLLRKYLTSFFRMFCLPRVLQLSTQNTCSDLAAGREAQRSSPCLPPVSPHSDPVKWAPPLCKNKLSPCRQREDTNPGGSDRRAKTCLLFNISQDSPTIFYRGFYLPLLFLNCITTERKFN